MNLGISKKFTKILCGLIHPCRDTDRWTEAIKIYGLLTQTDRPVLHGRRIHEAKATHSLQKKVFYR